MKHYTPIIFPFIHVFVGSFIWVASPRRTDLFSQISQLEQKIMTIIPNNYSKYLFRLFLLQSQSIRFHRQQSYLFNVFIVLFLLTEMS